MAARKTTDQIDLFSVEETPLFQTLSGAVMGVDEVGRGPLIGDVVAAAVVLPANCPLKLADSKKISEAKRIQLAEEIKQHAVAYHIAFASPSEIDELNILHATMLAMQRAIAGVLSQGVAVDIAYIDGNRCPKSPVTCQSVVKGDDKIAEISAASILAKVHRDQQMLELHKQFPMYGFDQHKGYPTKQHLEALQQYGLIDGYRHSFKPVSAMGTKDC